MYCVLSVGAYQDRRSRVTRCARPGPEIVNDVPAQTVYKLPRKREGLWPTWVRTSLMGRPYERQTSLIQRESYNHCASVVRLSFQRSAPYGVVDARSKRFGRKVRCLAGLPTACFFPYPSVEGSVTGWVYRATWRSASLGKPLRIKIGLSTPRRTNTQYPPFLRA